MRKRWIPFMLMCIVAAFAAGLSFGANTQAENQGAPEGAPEMARLPVQATTIAVVNADIGVAVHNGAYSETQNFSAAIIDTLDRNFALVSPAMAATGYESGLYAAIVTFPSNVSQRVLSFNAHSPEHVRLELLINPNLTEQAFIETHNRFMELQIAINTTIAYTYVSSMFEQFHAAQDQIASILQNDSDQLAALGIVNGVSFTPNLRLDATPVFPLEPNAPETSHFLVSVAGFAENVSGLYLQSYQAATDDYRHMRQRVVALTDDFPRQESEWIAELEEWREILDQYSMYLNEYSDYVRRHQEDLEGWGSRVNDWNEGLDLYQVSLADWHSRVDEWNQYLAKLQRDNESWYALASSWNDDLGKYHLEILDWRNVSVSTIEEHHSEAAGWYGRANVWHDGLIEWHVGLDGWTGELDEWFEYTFGTEEAPGWFETIQEELNEIEETIFAPLLADVAQLNNDVELLQQWYDYQGGYIEELLRLAQDYNDHVDDLHAIRTALDEWGTQLNNLSPSFRAEATALKAGAADLHNTLEALRPLLPMLYGIEGFEYIWPDIELAIDSSQKAIGYVERAMHGADWGAPGMCDSAPDLVWLALPKWDNGGGYNARIALPPPIETYFREGEFPDMEELLTPHTEGPPEHYDGAPEPFRNTVEEPPVLDSYQIMQAPSPFSKPIFELPQSDRAEPAGLSRPDIARPEAVDSLEAALPDEPVTEAPPRPDAFWRSLGDMHSHLNTFNIDDYLTPSYGAVVERMLSDYERYLETVRADLAGQFNHNVNMLSDVRGQYVEFLSGLRADALDAEADSISQLNDTLEAFSHKVEAASRDTRNRLAEFAVMMPESRTPLGLNHELVRFTVAPFDFVVYPARETARETVAAVFGAQTESTSGLHELYLRVAASALAGVFVLTLVSCGITWAKKRKKA